MNVRENVDLQSANTLAQPSVVEVYVELTDLGQVPEMLALANAKSLPVRVLGGGSNCLLPKKLRALVAHPKFARIEFLDLGDSVLVRAEAGVNWHDLVMQCAEKGFWGIENLALIPGHCGAAAIQNIGAYGVELASVLNRVNVVDLTDGSAKQIDAADCGLGYRDSVFKHRWRTRFLISSIELRLSKRANPTLSYGPLAKAFEGPPETPIDIARKVSEIRSARLPDPARLPNAGSFFKNPVISIAQYSELTTKYPDMVSFDTPGGRKIPAAWLIERCGWKGRECAGVCVDANHALVLTNPNGKSLDEILNLARKIQDDVARQFDIQLEIEPQRLDE